MIDKYRLDDLRLESGEKGELARWVIQLQKDLDYERRKVSAPTVLAAMDAEPVADVVAWHKEGEERTCDIRWRRFDVAPGPLFAVAQPVEVLPEEMNFSAACNFVQINGMAKEDRVTLAMRAWNACRAAMLNHFENERDMVQRVSQPYKLREGVAALRNSGIEIDAVKVLDERDTGNSPVIPDGWQLVPVEPTLEMIKSGANAASTGMLIPEMYRAMLAAAPQLEGE